MKDKIKEYNLRIPSQTENLEVIRNFVTGVAKKVGFEKDDIQKIELAVDEACTNVIEHAYKDRKDQNIDVAVKIDYNKLTVVVTDHGETFKPHDVKMPDMKKYLAELRVGGLGIYLMKTLMDEVDYKIEPGVKNEVHMSKYMIKHEGQA